MSQAFRRNLIAATLVALASNKALIGVTSSGAVYTGLAITSHASGNGALASVFF